MQDVSILLAGCGSIGKRHARVLTSLGVRNVLACDPDTDHLQSLLKECPGVRACDSFEAGLGTNPDAAFILTPPKMHIPMATAAILAGSHVFLEKPLSDTLMGGSELMDLVTASGKKAMVGLCFRYHEGTRKAKEMLDAGAIGRLVSIRALMGEYLPKVRPDYKKLFTAQYSGAFDLMHDIDLAIWYANQQVRSVQAVSGTYSDIGIQAPDVVEILIDFEKHCVASVHLDLFQMPRRRQMELIGTEGTMVLDFSAWDQYTLSVRQRGDNDGCRFTGQTARDDMFREEDQEFLMAVVEDHAVRCTIEEARKSLFVVDEAQRSAAGVRLKA